MRNVFRYLLTRHARSDIFAFFFRHFIAAFATSDFRQRHDAISYLIFSLRRRRMRLRLRLPPTGHALFSRHHASRYAAPDAALLIDLITRYMTRRCCFFGIRFVCHA